MLHWYKATHEEQHISEQPHFGATKCASQSKTSSIAEFPEY